MIKLKKIRPLYTTVITTAEKVEDSRKVGGLIDPTILKNSFKEFQRVVAVGDMVRNVKVGDLVCINPDAYAVREFHKNSIKEEMEEYKKQVTKYQFKMVELDGKECLFLQERDIDYVIERLEEVPDEESNLVI